MSSVVTELLIIGLLLLINGILAMAEISIVSARKARLRKLATGDARARAALAIAEKPMRFLSTVQVGITLTSIVAGAFSGRTIAENLASFLAGSATLAPYAEALAISFVVLGITLASVIFGELVPKRIGLHNPERVAMILAGPINLFSRLVSPVANALASITDRLLSLVGIGQPKEAPVTEEELHTLIEQGLHAGILERAEKEMVEGVLALDRLPVTALMTPRPKIVFLNIEDPDDVNWRKIVTSGHSYFPVYQGNRDQVVGMVPVKALWAHSAIGLPTTLKNLLLPPLTVPTTLMATQLLEQFKKSGRHIAIITDEFGAVQGLATLIDVLEAIVGDLPEPGQRNKPEAKRRDDGSWLVDAALSTAELKALLNIEATLPHENLAEYQTLGGFVVTQMGRIPAAGDRTDWAGWRFEVMDMDRRRVDKVLVSKTPQPAAEQKAAG